MSHQKLEDFLSSQFPKLAALGQDDSYRETGTLDSLGLMEFVEAVESHFDLHFEDHEINEDTIGSTTKLKKFLEGKGK